MEDPPNSLLWEGVIRSTWEGGALGGVEEGWSTIAWSEQTTSSIQPGFGRPSLSSLSTGWRQTTSSRHPFSLPSTTKQETMRQLGRQPLHLQWGVKARPALAHGFAREGLGGVYNSARRSQRTMKESSLTTMNIESKIEWIIFWQNSNIELNQVGYRRPLGWGVERLMANAIKNFHIQFAFNKNGQRQRSRKKGG